MPLLNEIRQHAPISATRAICQQNGLPNPKWHSDPSSGVTLTFFTPEVTPEVITLIRVLDGEMKRAEIQQKLALKDPEHFRKKYLLPALNSQVIAMTIPDKPTSRNQKYQLTVLGQQLKQKNSRA